MKKLSALRGASMCLNNEEDIQKQVVDLYDMLLQKNDLKEDDIVSIIFSVTSDITAKNPATALRRAGRATKAALFVCQEANFPNQLERVIRVLVHCYLKKEPAHLFRNGAETLRPDLNK